jgi:hypothetical protein
MALLELLGIPRVRVKGISIINVFGTIFVAYCMTEYINFIKAMSIDCFQMSCLLLVLAVIVHYMIGDHTPLVKLAMHDKKWLMFVILLGFTGVTGYLFLKYTTALYTIGLMFCPGLSNQ